MARYSSNLWRELPSEERAVYEDLANIDKERYEMELKEFNQRMGLNPEEAKQTKKRGAKKAVVPPVEDAEMPEEPVVEQQEEEEVPEEPVIAPINDEAEEEPPVEEEPAVAEPEPIVPQPKPRGKKKTPVKKDPAAPKKKRGPPKGKKIKDGSEEGKI